MSMTQALRFVCDRCGAEEPSRRKGSQILLPLGWAPINNNEVCSECWQLFRVWMDAPKSAKEPSHD